MVSPRTRKEERETEKDKGGGYNIATDKTKGKDKGVAII